MLSCWVSASQEKSTVGFLELVFWVEVEVKDGEEDGAGWG